MNDHVMNYDDSRHREQVVSLWSRVFGYEAAHNAPELGIDKKCAVNDGLFFVSAKGDLVTGTIMAGYDGHRGWIYSLAVLPEFQRQGTGKALLEHAEQELASRGCIKINLQLMAENEQVRTFYEANGFSVEDRICMGKCL